MDWMLAILIFILLFLCYSVIPTVLIRRSGLNIVKNFNQKQAVVLTFDDGPNPVYTEQLLDVLKKYQVKATFFVLGSRVDQYPEIVKRMHREGHTIGIHHYRHVSSWLLSPLGLRNQLIRTEKAIYSCIQEYPDFYRPPWGHFNLATLFMAKKYRLIMWSDIFSDWRIDVCKSTLLQKLTAVTAEGSILLLHDCGKTLGAQEEAPRYMIESLETYLKESKQKGIHFISLRDQFKESEEIVAL
ncbi:polysaccharide deacetylase family protein [Peribacillus saganii]|uniref:Polysaccharide deacetylase family protein n=1 Tax=Peribacillus saganii TaxID=2303992 RepID=A0A372LPC2_9BACI|nr:polysaccharide deacetylase family protein [Peribacillus saganii]RFU69149.1 polysaccharide deacetylase family protein [Peribacillus saganii]